MNNLELINCTRNTYRDTCKTALMVHYQFPYLLILTKDGLEVHDFAAPNCLTTIKLELPDCVNKLVYLPNRKKIWCGVSNGKIGLSFSLFDMLKSCGKEVPEFVVAEWDKPLELLAVIQSNGRLMTYVINEEEELKPLCVLPAYTDEVTEDANIFSSGVADFKNTQLPQIVWKPDSSAFAVSVFDDKRWQIKMFSYTCELLVSVGVPENTKPIISWCPFTNQLAYAVPLVNNVYLRLFKDVILNEFTQHQLYGENVVEDLRWSNSGFDVAVKQADNDTYQLNVYSFTNDRFTLKQSLRYPKANRLIDFDIKKDLNLLVLTVCTLEEATTYYFKESVCHNGDNVSDKPVVCAWINGCELSLSFCNTGTIPSRLYNLKVVNKYPINMVSFHPSKPWLVMLDSTNTLSTIKYSKNSYEPGLIRPLIQNDSELNQTPLRIRNLCWRNDNEIVYYADFSCSKQANQDLYVLNPSDTLDPLKITLDAKNISHVSVMKDRNCLIIQDGCKTVVFDREVTHSVEQPEELMIHVEVVWMNDGFHVFGVTNRGSLVADGFEVVKSVVSFIICNKLLVLILEVDKVCFIPLKTELLGKLCWSEGVDYLFTKPVEKGSRLLFALPNTSQLVIFNKRGNLELCTSRIACIQKVDYLIASGNWKGALEILRLQKLDLNIIIDLNANRFMNNTNDFVKSVCSNSVLKEFLVSIKDDNVFQGVYKDCLLNTPERMLDKRDKVMEVMINCMTKHNYLYYTNCIVIAEIRKSAIRLENVFNHLDHIFTREPQTDFVSLSKKIVSDIRVIKPELNLFKEALSTYNLSLSKFIAATLNLDPAEYEPLLDNFHKMEELQLRFEINKYLGKFEEGLCYCVKLCDNAAIFNYIKKHDLWLAAYRLLDSKSGLYESVFKEAMSQLCHATKHYEAATICLSVGNKQLALEVFVSGGFWKESLPLMNELKLASDEKNNFYKSIINQLIHSKRTTEAAMLLSKHLNNCQIAVDLLIDNNLFLEAIAIAKKFNQPELIEENIPKGIQNYFLSLSAHISSLMDTYLTYKDRLLKLRDYKKFVFTRSTNITSDNDLVDLADDEIRSQAASTIASTSSNMSRRTLARLQRKADNLNENSVYEDIALIKRIYLTIEELFNLGPQVRMAILASITIQEGIKEYMKDTYKQLHKAQALVKKTVGKVWCYEMTKFDVLDNCTKFIYQNIQILDYQYRTPPDTLDNTWVVGQLEEA